MDEPEEKQFKEVFDLTKCKLSLGPQTAFEHWRYEDPDYRMCTILGEMIIYLFVGILAMSIAVSLLVKRYKKRKQQALEGVGKTTPAPEESGNQGGATRVKTSLVKGLAKSQNRSLASTASDFERLKSFKLIQVEEAHEEEGEETKLLEILGKEESPVNAEGELLVHRLTVTIIMIPFLVYVFLLLIGLTILPIVMESMIMSPSVSQCQEDKDGGIFRFNPVSYNLINGSFELAILKIEKNKTGEFANLDYTVLYSYGKGGSVTYFLKNISDFAQQGFDVFAWDYPGHGESKGPGQPADIVAAQKMVLNFVSRKTKKPIRDIILYGFSLGGAITTLTAGDVHPKIMLLSNPLDALANVMVDFCEMTGFIAGPASIGKFLDAREALVRFAESGGCLLMFGGGKDQMIKYKRHRATYMRFLENSPTFCGAMVYEREVEHSANPWNYRRYPTALKTLLRSRLDPEETVLL